MKEKEKLFYMQTAENAALMSHAVRKKVGACVVTKNRGIYIGYNGRLEGQDNICEDEKFRFEVEEWGDGYSGQFTSKYEPTLITRKDVAHAELNCLSKMLKEGVSAEGATLILTLSPCTNCSVMIASAGIKKIIYKEKYRDADGLKILIDFGVEVEQYDKAL